MTKLATRDIDNISSYLQEVLKSNQAKNNFIKRLNKTLLGIKIFPYGSPKYFINTSLSHDYRGVMVKKYILFYYIDEKNKLIKISRVFIQNKIMMHY